jgi:hypothetical protein
MFSVSKLVIVVLVAVLAGCAVNNNYARFCHTAEAGNRYDHCIWPDLKAKHKEPMNAFLRSSIDLITDNLEAPKKDGGVYIGIVSLCVDRNGQADNIYFNRPSRNTELDIAFAKAVKNTKLMLPEDKCLQDKIYYSPLLLNFDQNDMSD